MSREQPVTTVLPGDMVLYRLWHGGWEQVRVETVGADGWTRCTSIDAPGVVFVAPGATWKRRKWGRR